MKIESGVLGQEVAKMVVLECKTIFVEKAR